MRVLVTGLGTFWGSRIAQALQPQSGRSDGRSVDFGEGLDLAELDARLDEEIPAKWADEVRRLVGLKAR